MTTCHHLHSEHRGGGRGQASHWHLPSVTTHPLADASAPGLVCSPLSLDNLWVPSAGSLLCDPSTASHLPGGGSPGCGPVPCVSSPAPPSACSSWEFCVAPPPLLRPQLSCQKGRPSLTNHPTEQPRSTWGHLLTTLTCCCLTSRCTHQSEVPGTQGRVFFFLLFSFGVQNTLQ